MRLEVKDISDVKDNQEKIVIVSNDGDTHIFPETMIPMEETTEQLEEICDGYICSKYGINMCVYVARTFEVPEISLTDIMHKYHFAKCDEVDMMNPK